MPAPDPQASARQIRRRLFQLLLQALGLVVALTVVLLLAMFVVAVGDAARTGVFLRPPANRALEGYYLGHGSWDGVEVVVPLTTQDSNEGGRLWQSTLLVDNAGRVLLDGGRADTVLVGQTYAPRAGDLRFPLRVRGETVGTLIVVTDRPWLEAIAVGAGLLIPVIVFSIPLSLLTIVIGFLLARRFVEPLADVAAAAQAVAGGVLSTRVPVRGPGDLRALTDSFNHMADALERSDQERRGLLADVAHELRTPLTVMRGKLEGIVDGIYPADADQIAPVLEETYTLERLVEDLRTLTLAETRQLHFERRPVDLGELAQRAAGLFDAEAVERQIVLSVAVEPGLPEVPADPQRVGQVLGNLLSNALRYVPAGGQVVVTVRRAAAGVEVVVADDGPGVAPADLPHLFDRFWRGEKSRTRAAGGAGLGLAIARQLIEAQAGTITAENVPAGGLRVAFVLNTSASS
ncbi:MAG: HAMP domain-containing protein [Anaerolineales bacterium]|nr:HAMP domain-containing protein [Anaerolineales bacterium]